MDAHIDVVAAEPQERTSAQVSTPLHRQRPASRIIFLGWSRLLFGLDWRLFEEFERKHHLKMFNMGFTGIASGEFSPRIIRKWEL